MNYFDIFFIPILLWAAYRGFATGFIVQVSSLLALFFGVFVAYKWSFWLAGYFATIVSTDPVIINTIAFVVTFAVVWALIVLLGKFLTAVVKVAMLSIANRILGLIFSLFKVAFALSIVLMLIGNLNSSFHFLTKEQTEKSLLYCPLEKLAPAIFPYLKTGFAEAQKHWDELHFSSR